MLKKAAEAAEAGADRTAGLTARAGRASYVAKDKVRLCCALHKSGLELVDVTVRTPPPRPYPNSVYNKVDGWDQPQSIRVLALSAFSYFAQ